PTITPEPAVPTSSTLTINDATITGLDPANGNNTAENFLAALNAPAGYTIRLVSPDGSEVAGLVGTGYLVRIMSSDTIVREYAVILYGDANGDGRINSSDLNTVFLQTLNRISLSDIHKKAADADKNDRIDSSDLFAVFKHILNRQIINQ
ncbi:MAG: dockerin type I repeat-containing protein, partial [Bacillota bacterium]|nr:dockerin type I repeat-containing protein [Bacillota bacterium]